MKLKANCAVIGHYVLVNVAGRQQLTAVTLTSVMLSHVLILLVQNTTNNIHF